MIVQDVMEQLFLGLEEQASTGGAESASFGNSLGLPPTFVVPLSLKSDAGGGERGRES